MLNEFAGVLLVSSPKVLASESRLKAVVNTRLVALGLGKVCGRCGGSGHFSYNPMNGTTCFGCSGSGFVIQKLTPALLEKAREAVAAGKLEPYLQDLRNKSIIDRASDLVMKAWKDTGIGEMYDWRVANDPDHPEDRRLSDINAVMYNAYQGVSNLATKYRSIAWDLKNKKRLGDADREILKARKLELEALLPVEVEKAIEKIKEAAAQI